MRKPKQRQKTNLLIWPALILCAVVAIAVVFAGIFVLTIYMIYQPKPPYLWVPYAHLNKLDYDQSGLLSVEMALTVVAENDNAKAHASFSDIGFVLRFYGEEIAELAADPLDVPKNSSFSLNYLVPSSMVPLDDVRMSEMDAALKKGQVLFDLDGKARTRWRLGMFVRVKLWTHLSCPLQFSPYNGSSIGLDCTSKSH